MSVHLSGRRGPAALAVASVAALGLSLVSVPAHAAETSITLLNINDWHGRIDANTVKFAGTIESLRAAAGEGNTLFLSDGDNIGASLFASASAEDQPTLDVLNALGLQASAVGNHEFDRGFAHLTDKVVGGADGFHKADFAYLGANVYLKGTTTPALPEYAVFDVGGLTVGVIGAVTIETPSLVSPEGTATLDFGDPVEAVNRVAEDIKDSVDVIVAEYHEGASAGTPDGATLEQEIAHGGAFADIVTATDDDVDVIFTGHTHKVYAWDAPVPGDPSRTRPVLQTGSYGENIGKVTLTVDSDTGDVSAYTVANVPRLPATTDDATLVATYPRVAAVKSIVDAALAASAVVGNQPVGTLNADITTAYATGSFVGGVWTPPAPATPLTGRDDRASESTLGNYVADALVGALSDPLRGGAEIGIVNPGGLRNELLYGVLRDSAGNPTNPADADGRILYSEANAVLPFVNNLWTLDLTGAQVKAVLEEQWQPDGTSRPYLHLGVSKNMQVTQDPSQPRGSRITSVWIDGKPLDPAATYRVGTFSFLATGGDNFVSFRQGTNVRDSGLIDRDAWIEYLTANQPSTPDYARRQVFQTGMPTSVSAGQNVSFTIDKAHLTSLGTPEPTTVDISYAGQSLGSFPVAGGSAAVSFTMPTTIKKAAVVTGTIQPAGTTFRIAAQRSTTTTTSVVRVSRLVRGVGGWMVASVSGGFTPYGRVVVTTESGQQLGAAFLENGTARIRLRPWVLPVGTHTVTVSYEGNGVAQPSSTTATIQVVRR
jgi:5'-nucleotidase